MKKGDIFWLASLATFVAILVVPVTREIFMKLTTEHVYLGGFANIRFDVYNYFNISRLIILKNKIVFIQ